MSPSKINDLFLLWFVGAIIASNKSVIDKTGPSECSSIIELVEDNGGQERPMPTITTYSDVFPDITCILQLEKLTLHLEDEKTFFFKIRVKKKIEKNRKK